MKIHLLFFLACVQSTLHAQILLTLQPGPEQGKDAKVWSIHADSNFAGDTELKANAWTWFGDAGVERSLFEFNLGNIPVNATICYAYLSLYASPETSSQTNAEISGSNAGHLYRIVDPWDEATVTWNTQPGYSTTNAVMIAASDIPYDSLIAIDITTLMQDMISNPAAHGFMFKLDDELYYRRRIFASSDATDTTHHPKLELCYTLPVGIGSTTAATNSVYPNPIKQGELHIVTNFAYTADGTCAIFNTMGQEICRMPLTQGAKPGEYCVPANCINALPVGQYALQISGNAGLQTSTFIKL